jgi:hypothetical protein
MPNSNSYQEENTQTQVSYSVLKKTIKHTLCTFFLHTVLLLQNNSHFYFFHPLLHFLTPTKHNKLYIASSKISLLVTKK